MSGVISRFDTYDGKIHFSFDPAYASNSLSGLAIFHSEEVLRLTPAMLRAIATAMEVIDQSQIEVTEFISNDHKITLTKNSKRVEDELGFPISVIGIKKL